MIKFAKKNESVKIPSKLDTNAGYDIYANFDEPIVMLPKHKTTLIPTGLFSSFDNGYYIQMFNRGSNGSKGLLQACGVIDSSYRGEWFVAVTNSNDENWYIAKEAYINEIPIDEAKNMYPYEKAICQFVVLPVPKIDVVEVKMEEIIGDKSDRGGGKLGSTKK